MECPRCESDLELLLEGLYEDIESHVCPDCEGAFLPAGNLDRLDESLVIDVERLEMIPLPAEPALRCPILHAPQGGSYRTMSAATLVAVAPSDDPTIRLHRCDECAGVWIEDDGVQQLRALAARLSAERNAELNARAKAKQKKPQ